MMFSHFDHRPEHERHLLGMAMGSKPEQQKNPEQSKEIKDAGKITTMKAFREFLQTNSINTPKERADAIAKFTKELYKKGSVDMKKFSASLQKTDKFVESVSTKKIEPDAKKTLEVKRPGAVADDIGNAMTLEMNPVKTQTVIQETTKTNAAKLANAQSLNVSNEPKKAFDQAKNADVKVDAAVNEGGKATSGSASQEPSEELKKLNQLDRSKLDNPDGV